MVYVTLSSNYFSTPKYLDICVEKYFLYRCIIGENKKFTDIKEEKFLDEIETSISLAQDRLIEKFSRRSTI